MATIFQFLLLLITERFQQTQQNLKNEAFVGLFPTGIAKNVFSVACVHMFAHILASGLFLLKKAQKSQKDLFA